MKVDHKNNSLLITDGERSSKLDEILAERFSNRGKLMLPSTDQYNLLNDDEGLKQVAYDMCRWLGVKPNQLKVVFNKQPNTIDVAYSDHTISINQKYRNHPYAVGTLLSFGVLIYCIDRYDKSSLDRAFVEYATLYTGFGLWVVNALRPHMNLGQTLYHAIDGTWFSREGMQLESYKADQYTHLVASYAHNNRIAPETYLLHVSRRNGHLFPEFASNKSSRRLTDPEKIRQHKKAANQMWVRIALLLLIVTFGTTVAVYVWSQRDKTNVPEKSLHQQSIGVIKESFESCIKKASEKQSDYDPNDLFMTRQIDATKSRCESLRNEYNYAVDQYRKLYP